MQSATSSSQSESSDSKDQRLADLLVELTNQVRGGHNPDLDAAVRLHPDLAGDLRALWPAVLVAEGLALSPSHPPIPPSQEEPTQPLRSFGDYDLLQELGRGGMGVVYKAWQRSLQRTVAIKMILRGDLASPEDLARFRVEAEAAARLDHPNIVPVYEIGDCAGQPYFSMKFVEGATLAHLAAPGPLPAREAARYLLSVARAVQHAHQAGILHRDLKPSNVLIDGNGQPHVTDFGLAKRVRTEPEALAPGSLTQPGAILGTPSYMAPEQAAGSRGSISPASDVYSLGAILYHLITGRAPFQAASSVDTLMLVLEQEPLPPRLLNPKVDRDLEMICLKCLQKPAELRYQTAAELAADLEAFLNDEPVSARSWSLGYLLSRVLRPTHHAPVLENWGLLWMWHSLVLLLLCWLTGWMGWLGIDNHVPYLLLWSAGLMTWAAIFWALRRRAGPVTFVERQIAHVWAAGVIGSISLFAVELLLPGMKVLTLSPILAVIAGMTFLIKGGMLSGSFYFGAAAFFVTAVLMAAFPDLGLFLFGLVSAGCFFCPGLKYYRQRQQAQRAAK